MAGTKQIHNYNAAISIDASADFLLIDPASTGNYNKINRNVLLGLSSAPLGTTDTQSPQNKIFDNTNSLTIKDGSLTIQNSSSTTKQAVLSAASITAGQTRTFTFPDASGTLVTTAGTQTLTNKTLTSPVISGGTVDNASISVDSISGHTSGTIVTVANLQISNGVLNSANAVTATSIANGAIQPQALVAGTGSGWAMQSFTPIWAGVVIGNGTVVAKYVQTGKIVEFYVNLTFGSTTVVSGVISGTLPVTANSAFQANNFSIGNGVAQNTGVTSYQLTVDIFSTTTWTPIVLDRPTTYVERSNCTASVPFSFTTGSVLSVFARYEAA